MSMTKRQTLLLVLAGPLTIPAAILGFLWQFVNYGWMVGNVAFNRLFQPKA